MCAVHSGKLETAALRRALSRSRAQEQRKSWPRYRLFKGPGVNRRGLFI